VANIKETAGLNGYTETTINELMSKHLFKRKIKDLTTLSPISKEVTTKRAGLTFCPGLPRKISNIMAKHDIKMVPKASGKLSQVLRSPKDVVDERAKSGIYEIQCQTCPAVYYGQTRRSIDKRFKEHMSMVRARAEEKSSVAKHLLYNPGHVITPEDLSLVKRVDRPQHLDAWENIIIRKIDKKHLFNEDYGNIESSLIDIFSK
jgi:hypothetical protein